MKINQNAPVVQKKQILINATPEKVWSVLSDINHWNKWNDKIKDPKLEGELKVGNYFTWKTNGTKIKSQIQIVEHNSSLGWTSKSMGASAIHNWYLKSTQNFTEVYVEESMEGWIINLMKKKMNEILANDMEYWLEQLKKESEK